MKARTWYVLLTLMWAIMFWSINVSLNRTKALTDEEVVEIPPVAVRNKWLGCHLSRDPAKNELLCRSWSSISQHFDAEAVLDGFTEVMPRSLYTFSAYYDHRDDSVRILALTAGQNANSQKQRHVCCVLQYSDGSGNHLYDIVTADFISFYEMHLNRYYSHMIKCQGNSSLLEISEKEQLRVSLVYNVTSGTVQTSPNLLQIRHAGKGVIHNLGDGEKNRKFTVCSSVPVHGGRDMFKQFVEWVEINALFGAEKFVVYNHSASWEAYSPYISYLVESGKMEVIQWPLESIGIRDPVEDVYYYSQMLSMNDCLYRSMDSTTYVTFLDLDEILVPRREATWSEMLLAVKGRCAGAREYHALNVFFLMNSTNDKAASEDPEILDYDVRALLKTERDTRIYPEFFRSKYFVEPEFVDVAEMHQVLFYYGEPEPYELNSRACILPKESAFLHHYREWKKYSETTVDRFLHKHRQAILERLGQVRKKVKAL